MIEAVIWDFGGVITSSPLQAFARFERERGLPEGFIARVNTTNYLENAWARFERGEIDHASFDKLFAEESRTLGHVVQGADVLPLLAGDLRPQMVEALRRIHARMKTGCITNNMPATGDTRARSPYRAEVMKLFHHVIESAKIGLRKPDPRIYTMMVEALQVDPRQAIYLDDLGVNLKPARALGMRTIKVIEPDDALTELEEAVGFPLR